ncbi:MAG: GerMN domain-containing protein [Firmicutes bacterium]|nr:GerMN domain-containing protein [Bacillota bacterium]
MKKFTILMLICFLSVSFYRGHFGQTLLEPVPNAKIYYVDRQLHRLIPVECYTGSDNAQKSAQKMLDELILGQDSNSEILRTIPPIQNGLSARIENRTAIVDISDELAAAHTVSPDNERLTIYQIVNSLTSIDGIDCVKFTIGGKTSKKFVGFVNMSEIFTPNYCL